MSFEEFQKLLKHIKEFRNPKWFTYEAFGIKGHKVECVECKVDYNTNKVTHITIHTTAGVKKTFDVNKDLDSWRVQAWLAGAMK